MAQKGPLFSFALFACAALIDVIYAAECVQESPCICRFDDDSVLNLSRLTSGPFLDATKGNLTVYYHGCTDAKQPEIVDIKGKMCDVDLNTLYLFNKTNGNVSCLGGARTGKFRTAPDNAKMHEVVYKYNSTTTEIRLVCTPDYEDNLLVLQAFEKPVLKLHLLSAHACPYMDHTGLSTGSKLVIMFFTFGAIYLFGGACLSYFVRGARGREIVPNIDFWMGLPRLVRDGAIFVMSGCNTRAVPTDSYDQI